MTDEQKKWKESVSWLLSELLIRIKNLEKQLIPEKQTNDSQSESLESFHKKMMDGDYPRFCGLCGSKLGSNKLKAMCKKCEKDLLKKGEL